MAQPVDFIGLNTFIYEPVGWDPDQQGVSGTESIKYLPNVKIK